MTAEAWTRKQGIVPTDLQLLRMKAVETHEQLCKACLLQGAEALLCAGLKPVFSEEESDDYGVLRIVEKPCDKLMALQATTNTNTRFARLHLPPSVISATMKRGLPVVTLEDYVLTVDGAVWPTQAVATTSVKLAEQLFGVIVELCIQKQSPRFVYPHWWYTQADSWYSLGFDGILEADFVFVERIDSNGGPAWAREAMFTMIQQRIMFGLPLVVTLGPNPEDKGKNDFERELIKEIQTWQQLP